MSCHYSGCDIRLCLNSGDKTLNLVRIGYGIPCPCGVVGDGYMNHKSGSRWGGPDTALGSGRLPYRPGPREDCETCLGDHPAAKDQRSDQKDDENEEQNLRDTCCRAGDTTETEDTGDNCDQEEHQCPTQHGDFSFECTTGFVNRLTSIEYGGFSFGISIV